MSTCLIVALPPRPHDSISRTPSVRLHHASLRAAVPLFLRTRACYRSRAARQPLGAVLSRDAVTQLPVLLRESPPARARPALLRHRNTGVPISIGARLVRSTLSELAAATWQRPASAVRAASSDRLLLIPTSLPSQLGEALGEDQGRTLETLLEVPPMIRPLALTGAAWLPAKVRPPTLRVGLTVRHEPPLHAPIRYPT